MKLIPVSAASFLSVYEKLERLVHRLPEALQGPILREITPIKTFFLLQRPPRIVLLGERAASKARLINALVGSEVVQANEEALHDGVWQSLTVGRGRLQMLDARRPVTLKACDTALGAQAGDIYVFVRSSPEIDGTLADDLDHAARVIEFADRRREARPCVLGLQFDGEEIARDQLHSALHTQAELEPRLIGTLLFTGAPEEVARLVEILAAELPDEAKLEMARLSGNRALQKQIAQIVVKSVTAICAAVGTQPIPLADFPILTSLQALMVAGIMHISGRELSPRLAGEFIGALGANLGAALVLREGARAALKLIPIWGDFVAGAIAAAGTYGIGRAAVAYFIDGVSIKDARRIFRRRPKQPRPPLLTD